MFLLAVAVSSAFALTTPTLSIATSSAPAIYGGTVTFTATISSGPTGAITFFDNGTAIGTGTIAGTIATYTTTTLVAGAHAITAGWAGNANYSAVSSSPIIQIVQKPTTTTLSLSTNSIVVGTSVTLVATVKSATAVVSPGLVDFCDASAARCEDMALLGTAQLGGAGTATMKLRLGVGTRNINAVFFGTSTYQNSTSSTQTVTVTSNGIYPSNTSLAANGVANNYTLIGSVTGSGTSLLSGTLSFLDTSNSGAQIGQTVTLGTPSYQLKAQTIYPDNGPTSEGDGLVITDLNSDGIPDAVQVNSSANTVSILLGNGDGTFQTAVAYAVGSGPWSVAVGDFNSDGHTDLAVTNNGDSTVSVLLGNGNGTFQTQVTYMVGTSPGGVAVGDFNGDGNADLAVVASNGNTISVLLGNGDGTFQAELNTAAAHPPSELAVKDFNGDGILDIALSSPGNAVNSVEVFLGKGNGTFQEPVTVYSSTSGTFSLAVADFNGDGIPDFVFSLHGSTANSVEVVLSNGNGTFQTPVSYTVGTSPGAVGVGDMNLDGKPDIIVPCATGTVSILLGYGDGRFQPQVSYAAGTSPSQVAIADLNGDGLPDVLSNSGGALSVLLNTQVASYSTSGISFTGGVGEHNVVASYSGNGNYAASTSNAVGLTSINTTPTLTVAGPGTPSTYGGAVIFTAIISNGLPGTVTFYNDGVSIGTGTISGTTATLTTNSLAAGTHSITASWPGNGTFSPVTSLPFSQIVSPAIPTLTVTASSMPSVYGGAVTFTAMISNGLTGSVTFYDGATSIGTGSISGTTATSSTSTLSLGLHVITAKWGGNANYAAVTSQAISQEVNSTTETTTLSVSSSSVSQGTPVTLTATVKSGTSPVYPGLVKFCNASAPMCEDGAILGTAQLNSSGAASMGIRLGVGTQKIYVVFVGTGSLAASTSNTQTVVVTSNSSYSSATSLIVSGVATDFTLNGTVGDFGPAAPSGAVTFLDTSNGNMPLGSAVLSGSSLALQAPALFGDDGANCGDDECIAVVADVDGDGIPDVAYTNSSHNILAISIGNGDGTFQAPAIYATGNNPAYLAVGDFNADGVPDIAVSNNGSGNTISVFIGNGDGTFQPQVAYTVGSAPSGIVIGDFNRDGTADILVVNGNSNSISVLLGNGDGTFQSQITTGTTGHAPAAIVVADFNGDGKLDLAAAINYTTTTSEIAVYLGNGNGTFQSPTMYTQTGTYSMAVADFNLDGIPDLVYSDHTDNNLMFMLGNGDGTFKTASPYALPADGGAVATGDFNQDGIPDIVIPGNGPTWILLGNGDGTFKTPITYQAGGTGVAVADVNGDGLPDVLALDGDLSVMLNSRVANYNATGISFAGSVGNHCVVASYVGNGPYSASTSSCAELTSNNTTPTLTLSSSASPAVYGGLVTFTATISTGPTGAITFHDGSSTLGSVAISGITASYTTSALVGGTHSITASWPGNATYSSVTSSAISHVVNLAAPTISVTTSGTPSIYGGSTTFTATVPSGLTGTVTFYDSSVSIGTATINGTTATYATSNLTAGTHVITAGWTGNADYSAVVSSAITQIVNKATPTLTLATSVTPSAYGGSVTFTATVSNGPTGSVTFYDAGAPIGTSVISGLTASFTTSVLSGGTHSISVGWAGNSNYSSIISSATTQTVNKGTSTLIVSSSAAPSDYGSSLTFTATISNGPTGLVTFYDSGTSIGTGSISGTTASFTTSTLSGGTHSITASWVGNTNYSSVTSSAISQTVNKATPILSVISLNTPSIYGGSVAFTATMSGGPTGVVNFLDNGSSIGTGTINGGSTTLTTTSLVGGTHSITASWAGNTNYSSVTSSAIVQTVNKATPTLSVLSSGSPSIYGESVSLTATISSGPTGTVTFSDGGSSIGSGPISGTIATFATNTLTAGTHTLTASWAGSTNYNSITSSAVIQVVNKATPILSVTSSISPSAYGVSVTFSAIISNGATGTVTFSDSGASIGTGNISSTTATLTTSVLAAGTHTITASWPSNANFNGATSSAITQTVSDIALPGAGIINTIAGNGTAGYNTDGVQAISSELNVPIGVAVDSTGNIYIADHSNYRIRKVAASTGLISTIAGTGTFGGSLFGDTPFYNSLAYAGNGGPATNVPLGSLSGVAVDAAGNVYFSDADYCVVHKVNAATGAITVVAGFGTIGYGGDGGQAISAFLYNPSGIAVDAAGNIYIADSTNYRIRKVTASTGIITTVAGTGYQGPGPTSFGGGYSGDGGLATSAEIGYVQQIAIDSTGNLFIADSYNNRVRMVAASTGIITTVAGNGTVGPSGDGGLATSAAVDPGGVFVNSAGDIFIADSYRIREVVASTGIITTVAGNGSFGPSGDGGPATSAAVDPSAVSLDAAGDIFLSDINRIRIVGPSKTTPILSWLTPSTTTYGTTLSTAQLNASSNVPGTFAYSPTLGTILTAGSHTLSVVFTPTDSSDYSSASATVTLMVNQATPTITWATPANITSGTALTTTQLDASNTIPGTLIYTPSSGTILAVGPHTLSVTLTPTDSTDYTTATASVNLTVSQATAISDIGTITLSVNGVLAASTNYSSGATPSTIAEGLAAGVTASSFVNITAVDDALYLEAKQAGAGTDYTYSLQTANYDTQDFTQPSFLYPAVTGTLDGGANQNASGGTVYSYSVPATGGYDGVGNLLSYTDSVMGTWSFNYDTLNRLAGASNNLQGNPSANYCWGYDPFGNRTMQMGSSAPFQTGSPACILGTGAALTSSSWANYNRTANNNQLVNDSQAVSGVNYDAAGDVIYDGNNQYLYDGDGRICAVASTSIAGITVMTGYIYNADG